MGPPGRCIVVEEGRLSKRFEIVLRFCATARSFVKIEEIAALQRIFNAGRLTVGSKSFRPNA
jgi:hypothetical protein